MVKSIMISMPALWHAVTRLCKSVALPKFVFRLLILTVQYPWYACPYWDRVAKFCTTGELSKSARLHKGDSHPDWVEAKILYVWQFTLNALPCATAVQTFSDDTLWRWTISHRKSIGEQLVDRTRSPVCRRRREDWRYRSEACCDIGKSHIAVLKKVMLQNEGRCWR